MNGMIDYGRLMRRALRGLLRDVLADVAETGLPGEHHFLLTIDTTHPDLDVPAWLKELYPDELRIVLQHWFENLEVAEDRFGVTLNFNETPERLVIPFDAVKSFVDPSVEFGLRFDLYAEEEEAPEVDPLPEPKSAEEPAGVVQLDRFRKN